MKISVNKLSVIALCVLFVASVTILPACSGATKFNKKKNCKTSKAKRANMKKNTSFMVR